MTESRLTNKEGKSKNNYFLSDISALKTTKMFLKTAAATIHQILFLFNFLCKNALKMYFISKRHDKSCMQVLFNNCAVSVEFKLNNLNNCMASVCVLN